MGIFYFGASAVYPILALFYRVNPSKNRALKKKQIKLLGNYVAGLSVQRS